MSITFSGLAGVSDRILFTNLAPIVKQPLPLRTGDNLDVVSANEVQILTGPFLDSDDGKLLEISGSPDGRNDGRFYIVRVKSPTNAILEGADFDWLDYAATDEDIVRLSNELKINFNRHRIQPGVHGESDSVNIVTADNAVDLDSAILLLNDVRAKFAAHIVLTGSLPYVHKMADVRDSLTYAAATSIQSALLLVNQIRALYESHRQELDYHFLVDSVNRILSFAVRPVVGSGPLVGPFTWTMFDPRIGVVADNSSDVMVNVNGTPVSIDAVFGVLGAIVLTNKPDPSDDVRVNYDYLNAPPIQFSGLNQPEFVLNQAQNRAKSGLVGHLHPMMSFLADPARFNSGAIRSAYRPYSAGYKYKGYERAYTAGLNDPNTLLLNVPTNRVAYPVQQAQVFEQTVRYDPTTFPQNATDPWTLEGIGVFQLASGGGELTIIDSEESAGPESRPPFFSHLVDFQYPSWTSCAFRAQVSESEPDGVFTGVGFGIVDGPKVALVGFIQTRATNLSSAIVLSNAIKGNFNQHLMLTGIHIPDDPDAFVDFVDAHDLASLFGLLNRLKMLYNFHLSHGPTEIHFQVDTADMMIMADLDIHVNPAADASTFANTLAALFNAHRVRTDIHYTNDDVSVVGPVHQVGVLKSGGFYEFEDSWEAHAADWTKFITYRVTRDEAGNIGVFFSGEFEPAISVAHVELPEASSQDYRLDDMNQIFFGAVGDQAICTSQWAFIRANITPLDSNQSAKNKSVSYDATTVPELAPESPWVRIGQSGQDVIVAGKLMSDSTASAPASEVADFGLLTGTYLGYLRLEPSLVQSSTCAVEFTAALAYWTFSLDNQSAGVFLDDDILSVHLLFLQADPTPASLSGTSTQPFNIQAGDTLIVQIGNFPSETIVFPSPVTTAGAAAAVINNAVGFTFATALSGRVALTSSDAGADAKFVLLGGIALSKLGLSPGTYFGRDSNPEPKISYFGANFPNLDVPNWSTAGSQKAEMMSRTLRITDSSNLDFLVYTLADVLYTSTVITPRLDWKLDVRLAVLAFQPGDSVTTGNNLRFCGALVNMDEGPTGKNVELELAVSLSGVPFLNILSYNNATGKLDSISEVQFMWNDGQVHSYNIFTNKLSDLCTVWADGTLIGTFAYSALRASVSDPSISFGSGSAATANANLATSRSVVDWQSVAIFRDSKLQNPQSASQRYVGIFGGGDPSKLSSYYLHQIDWSQQHTYRIVRDPTSSVSVFVDGSPTPSISTSYETISLPPVSGSFFKNISRSRPQVSFGSFNPTEISRVFWSSLQYSIGKLTVSDRLIPPHQVLNQGNVVASPEHLRTTKPHVHLGFHVWSGGTPTDDFMSDAGVPAFTTLLENTAPVPATQNLETRGGFEHHLTAANTVPIPGFVNEDGFLSDFENDLDNIITPNSVATFTQSDAMFVARANELRALYESHRQDLALHASADSANALTAPMATDFASVLVLINNIRTKLNSHLLSPVHVSNDTANGFASPTATDYGTAQILIEAESQALQHHAYFSNYHATPDTVDEVVTPDAVDLVSAVSLINEICDNYNLHRVQSGVHIAPDSINIVTAPTATDLASARTRAVDFDTVFNSRVGAPQYHRINTTYHVLADLGNAILASVSSGSTLPELLVYVNEAKARFNAHLVQPGVHVQLDTVNYASGPGIDLIPVTISVLNEFKTRFNTHIASATYHFAVDGIHAISAPDATDEASAITLANNALAQYNGHLSASYHLTVDSQDACSTPACTDTESLIVLMQDLKSRLDVHRSAFGAHGRDDLVNVATSAAVVDLATANIVLNDVKARFNSHRIYVGSHLQDDLLYNISAPNAIDLDTAIGLAGNLRQSINAHLVDTDFHVVGDTNNIIIGTLNNLSELLATTQEIRTKYNAHRTNMRLQYHSHGFNDSVNVVTTPTPMRLTISLFEDMSTRFDNHLVAQIGGQHVHERDDAFNTFVGSPVYRLSVPESYRYDSLFWSVESLTDHINAHFNAQNELTDPDYPIHITRDLSDPVTPTDVDSIPSAISQLLQLKDAFNRHLIGRDVHYARAAIAYATAAPLDPYRQFQSQINVTLEALNDHFVRQRSHDVLDRQDQIDLEWLLFPFLQADALELVNAMKASLNAHLVHDGSHVHNDTVNTVLSPDATDMQSASVLLNDIVNRFNLHRIQEGVHGSLVFIRLDVPDGVLYESMKFFKTEIGEKGHVASLEEFGSGYLYDPVTLTTTTITP